jgi:spermidine synthase
VLGVGGGAAIRHLLHYSTAKTIAGVEISPVHLYVAKRFFGLNDPRVQLIQQDAEVWFQNYKGAAFDLIIDDLFGEENGQPVRAVDANKRWCRLLMKNTTPCGAVVLNSVSFAELKKSAFVSNPVLQKQVKSAFCLTTPATENSVGVFLKNRSESGELRYAIREHAELSLALKRGELRFRIRKLQT